jgi:hypothetical protein
MGAKPEVSHKEKRSTALKAQHSKPHILTIRRRYKPPPISPHDFTKALSSQEPIELFLWGRNQQKMPTDSCEGSVYFAPVLINILFANSITILL